MARLLQGITRRVRGRSIISRPSGGIPARGTLPGGRMPIKIDTPDLLPGGVLDFTTQYGQEVIVAKKGGQFSTIQAAINSITDASATKPYNIIIRAGYYYEAVTLKPYVTLLGAGANIVIDRQSDGATLTLTSNTRVRNLAIENRSAGGGTAIAVYGDGVSNVIFYNCMIGTYPTTTNATAIGCQTRSSSIVFYYCYLRADAPSAGGTAYAWTGSGTDTIMLYWSIGAAYSANGLSHVFYANGLAANAQINIVHGLVLATGTSGACIYGTGGTGAYWYLNARQIYIQPGSANYDAVSINDANGAIYLYNCTISSISGTGQIFRQTAGYISVYGTLSPSNASSGTLFGTTTLFGGNTLRLKAATSVIADAPAFSPASARQYLVNGGFEMWQRGAGAFTANNAYTADRWQILLAGTDTLSVSREGTNKKTNSLYAAAVAFTLGTGAGGTQLRQALVISDNYHGLLGQAISLRIPIKLSAAVADAVRAFIQTDGTGGTTTYSAYHGNNTNWENLDVNNITVPSDATYVRVGVAFAASCTAYVDNAMLIMGNAAVDYVPLTPEEELSRCQRYYEVWGGTAIYETFMGGFCNGTTSLATVFIYKVTKAVVPTLTFTAANTFAASVSGVVLTGTGISAAWIGLQSANINLETSGLTAGQGGLICANNTTSAHIYIEANP